MLERLLRRTDFAFQLENMSETVLLILIFQHGDVLDRLLALLIVGDRLRRVGHLLR